MPRWKWLITKITNRLWFRSSIFCLAGIGSALLALYGKTFIPDEFSRTLEPGAIEDILNIIASSMLAVTIFSLTTMVAAFRAVTDNATPRSTKLLISDRAAQNALSTFLGSFIFSLVGIITIKLGLYEDSGRIILFVITIGVITLVVATMLSWIEYLIKLGRVGETIKRIEQAATEAISNTAKDPYFGAKPFNQDKDKLPSKVTEVYQNKIGYLQHIDMASLNSVCDDQGVEIYVNIIPGSFCDGSTSIASVKGTCGDDDIDKIRNAFMIDEVRSFTQDPRYGLIVLSEIASKALSPGINDPGTAIAVIVSMTRILSYWQNKKEPISSEEKDKLENKDGSQNGDSDGIPVIKYPSIHMPCVDVSSMFNGAFNAIARDGASILEVQLYLQKSFKSLSEMAADDFKENAERHSYLSYQRALAEMSIQEDKDRLKEIVLRKTKPKSV